MGYIFFSIPSLIVEILRLGHQDAITSIDALTKERAITAGGRDNSVRVWKIPEESQLIFNGHQGSIDCVRLVNEDHFISCGDDGYCFHIFYLKFIRCYNRASLHG